ncbi:MAG TPA: gephyrin-like molybdotransferase Glp [Limnochordales bacterium]
MGLEGLCSYEEALARVLGAVAQLRPLGDEQVELELAGGRVLAQEVVAARPVPPYARAAMDGFAVRSGDVQGAGQHHPVVLRLVGTAVAGEAPPGGLGPGQCLRIMTGVPLPEGADAVVPQEMADLEGDGIRVRMAVAPGSYVFPAGEDAAQGERVLAPGTLLGPGQLALLASLGVVRPLVRRRPVVVVAATGDEVVGAEVSELRPGQVRNSNAYAVAEQVRRWGGQARLWGIVPDQPQELARVARAMAQEADLLVFTGGMSVGLRDLVRPVLQELGVRWLVHRVAIRPGRPFAFGVWEGRAVVGLPGTPGGAFVACELFVRPLMAAWLGRAWAAPECAAVLAEPLRMRAGRLRLVRVRVWVDEAGELRVQPVRWQSSASVRSLAEAGGLMFVPPELESLAAGERVRVRLLGDL